jgi:tetratricopeptide (TPR) repeat protein
MLTIKLALPILEEAYGPDHPDVGKALGNLGAVQLRLRELKNARASIGRALPILERAYGPEHPEVAQALITLASVQRRLRQPRDARASAERALAINEAAYGPDHPEVANALLHQAAAQLWLLKLKAAMTKIRRALAIFKAANEFDPYHGKILMDNYLSKRGKITKYLLSLAMTSPSTRPNPERQQFNPAPNHQSRDDQISPNQPHFPASDDQAD